MSEPARASWSVCRAGVSVDGPASENEAVADPGATNSTAPTSARPERSSAIRFAAIEGSTPSEPVAVMWTASPNSVAATVASETSSRRNES